MTTGDALLNGFIFLVGCLALVVIVYMGGKR